MRKVRPIEQFNIFVYIHLHSDLSNGVTNIDSVTKYYEYIKYSKNIEKDITFETKAESKYPAVAVSSIIARYSFLVKMTALSKTIGKLIPKGAGENVDKFGKEFVEKYGKDKLKEY